MFFVFIVLLCIVAYYHCNQNTCPSHKSRSFHREPLDILRERYARGEMSSEEFNERKKALE